MTLKNDWGTGDTYNASDMNEMATAINAVPSTVSAMFVDNGDGTWTLTVVS